MTIRILHTADLHLGASLTSFGDFAEERQRDFVRTFDRIVTLAIKREVDVFVVAGDLFDSTKVDGALVGRVQEAFSRLAARRIAVVVIPGTHDNVMAAASVYRRYPFPGVHLLMDPVVTTPVRVEVRREEVCFYGFAYRGAASEGALGSMSRRDGAGIHIGLLHGSLQGSPEWDIRRKDLPFTPAELALLGLDYIALGHYHDFAPVTHDGRAVAWYPGSPEGRRFGENGERNVIIAEVSATGAVVEKVPIQSRRLVMESVDVSLFPDTERVVEELRKRGSADTVARLRLTGVVEDPLDPAHLLGRLQGNFGWLELIDDTDLFDSAFLRRVEREDSVRGLFLRKMEERRQAGDEAARDLCREAVKAVWRRFQGEGNR